MSHVFWAGGFFLRIKNLNLQLVVGSNLILKSESTGAVWKQEVTVSDVVSPARDISVTWPSAI